MRCVDVNVLVDAHRPDTDRHEAVRAWLERARREPEPLGLSSVVASGFIRVVTHPRVFKEPTPTAVALEFVEGLRLSPAVLDVAPGERHWSIFTSFCREQRLAGNLVPDAWLAALAVELGASFVTSDRGFTRYPGLRIEEPVA